MNRDNLLDTLSAILDFGHVEAARLILTEVRKRPLGAPDAEPLHWMNDASFAEFRQRIEAEALRRERGSVTAP